MYCQKLYQHIPGIMSNYIWLIIVMYWWVFALLFAAFYRYFPRHTPPKN